MRKDSSLNVTLFLFSILGAALAFLLGELVLTYSPFLPFSVPFWVQCGVYLLLAITMSCLVMVISEKIKSGNYILKHQREFGMTAGKAMGIFLPAALALGILTQFLYSWGGVAPPVTGGNIQHQGTMIVADISGSMNDNDPDRVLIDALTTYVDSVPLREYLGIILFSSEFESIRDYAPLRSDSEREELKQRISEIQYGGGTIIDRALISAIEDIRQSASEDWPGLVLLFSDGDQWEFPMNYDGIRSASEGDRSNTHNAVPVNTIFLSESPDNDGHQLRRIAQETNGEFILLSTGDDPAALRDVFSKSRTSGSFTWLDDQHLIHGSPRDDEDLAIRIIIRVALLLLWGVFSGILVVIFLNNNRLIKHFLIFKLIAVFLCTLAFPVILMFVETGYANMIARAVLVAGICIMYPPTYSWDIHEQNQQFRMHSGY